MIRSRAIPALLVAFGAVVACSSGDDAHTTAVDPAADGGINGQGPVEDLNLPWNPTFDPDYNNLVANPAALPVSTAQRDAVTVTPTGLQFDAADAEDAQRWSIGQIVVGAPGEGKGTNPLGFARRVTAIRHVGDKVIVDTMTVGLEDIAAGEFQVRFDPALAKPVDLSKLDLTWAANNLYRNSGVVFMPGEPLVDNTPGATRVRGVPGQPNVWDDFTGAATSAANAVGDAVVSGAHTLADGTTQFLDDLGNIIPDSFGGSVGLTNEFTGSGNLPLFDALNFEKTINGKGNLPLKLSMKGSGGVNSAITFNPGFQIGARIPNYLNPNHPSFQTWVNVDSRAQASITMNLQLTAALESAGGTAGSDLEKQLNDNATYAENVLSSEREALFGDPDLKPAGGWKKTLYLSKPSTQVFFAGPVPVVITSTVQVDLECGFQAKATINALVYMNSASTFKFKAIYDSTKDRKSVV